MLKPNPGMRWGVRRHTDASSPDMVLINPEANFSRAIELMTYFGSAETSDDPTETDQAQEFEDSLWGTVNVEEQAIDTSKTPQDVLVAQQITRIISEVQVLANMLEKHRKPDVAKFAGVIVSNTKIGLSGILRTIRED